MQANSSSADEVEFSFKRFEKGDQLSLATA
jgi:hypothetical protein